MNVRVGIALLLTIIVAVVVVDFFSEPEEQSLIRARLDDVQGLPVGAPVTIAGLSVGSVVGHRIGPGYSEVEIRFHDSVDLRADAVLYKKRHSPLAGPSLEIDPGTARAGLSGNYIERVVETTPIGDVLSDISEALPAVHEMSTNAQRRADDLRAHLNGPYQSYIESLDTKTKDLGKRMHSRLERMNEALKISENMEFDADKAINPGIERAEELSSLAQESLQEARNWVVRTAGETRKEVDDTRVDWSPYSRPIHALDDGEGTLGKLLNDSELYDDTAEISKKTKSYMRSLVRWQMRVGLLGEYAGNSGQTRGYVTVKAGHTDRFYYLELVTSSQGGAPEVSLTEDQGTWRRGITIPSKLKITAQFARRFGPAVFRYGLKESSFGAGTDIEFFDHRLEVSADIFEFGHQNRPHLKVAASYELFGALYIRAGLDDILNPSRSYNIVGDALSQTLTELYVGRDYFLGASLHFSDRDLAALLRIGGAAIAALATGS